MIRARQRIATAVPQKLQKRLEITEAIRTLAAQEDEPLRQRQAEIASLRRELTEIALAILELQRACDPRLRSYVLKANPDDPKHPGWPAGTPGGRGGKFRPKDSDESEPANAAHTAQRRIALSIEEKCEAQYERDLDECRLVGSPACYAQAMLRYSNCLRGLPIPPLIY